MHQAVHTSGSTSANEVQANECHVTLVSMSTMASLCCCGPCAADTRITAGVHICVMLSVLQSVAGPAGPAAEYPRPRRALGAQLQGLAGRQCDQLCAAVWHVSVDGGFSGRWAGRAGHSALRCGGRGDAGCSPSPKVLV
jgi:hypothetical protein